nr:hypothetical protein [Tanacetum cinerariifolium]
MSRTKKNGSIVNAVAAKVIKELLNDTSRSTSNTTNDVSTSTSNTTTGNGIVDWSNGDLVRVKGKEKGDYARCVAHDSSSVHNPGPYGNSTPTRARENKKIRKVKQRVGNCGQTLKTLKRDDLQLLRKFEIQFKGDPNQSVKTYLGKCFAMKDLGEATYILGIKIYRDRSKRLIGLCQSAYIEKILKRYYMENSKRGSIPMQEKLKLSKSQGASTPAEMKRMQNVPYASAVGSIMYAVRCTRPDVAFAQNITSRFQQNPGDIHWTTVKNILKYLRNTKDVFLVYGEAEYIAAFDASKKAVWVRKFISRLRVVPIIEEPISMYFDNTGAIVIANESGITKGARHFRAKVHYRREVIELGDIKLEKVHTDDNLVDPFTKALAFPKHSEHTKNIGMLPATIAKDDGVIKGARHFRAKVHYLRETVKLGDVKIEKIQTDDNLADPFTKALAFPKHSELTRNIGLLPASSFIVGNGELGENGELQEHDEQDGGVTSWVTIPLKYCVPADETGMLELIDFIYDQETLKTPTARTLQEKAIVCLKNDNVDIINANFFSGIKVEAKYI